jgi:hypothetical protein
MQNSSVSWVAKFTILFVAPTAILAQQAPPTVPPSAQASGCPATGACLRPNNGQNASAPDLTRQPIDLTLQYPGNNPPQISPQGAVDVAGKVADASGPMVKQIAGPGAGAALHAVGTAAGVITTGFDVVGGAVSGYQNGGGVPGATAGATQAAIVACVGAGTTLVVTAACTPALGPAAPVVGVVAGAIAEDATKTYLNNYQAPTPSDNSFSCAKNGDCAPANNAPPDNTSSGSTAASYPAQSPQSTQQSQTQQDSLIAQMMSASAGASSNSNSNLSMAASTSAMPVNLQIPLANQNRSVVQPVAGSQPGNKVSYSNCTAPGASSNAQCIQLLTQKYLNSGSTADCATNTFDCIPAKGPGRATSTGGTVK